MPDTFNLGNVADLTSQVQAAPVVVPPVSVQPGVPVGLPPLGVPVQQAPVPALPEPVPAAPAITAPAITAPATPAPSSPGPARAAPPPAVPAELGQLKTDANELRATANELDTANKEGEALKAADLKAQNDEKQRQAEELRVRQEEQARTRAQSEFKVNAIREKAANQPYHTLFQDSPGRAILAGLSVLAGAVSWSPDHQNQAARLVQEGIKADFEKQQAEHAKLWKDVEAAQQQGRDLSHDQVQEMADIRARQASQLDAVIAQGLKLAGPNQARRAALEDRMKALGLVSARDQAVDESVRLHQSAEETRRHNRTEEGIQYGHLGLEKAKAGVGGAGGPSVKELQLANRIAQGVRNGAQGKVLTIEENRLQQAQASAEALKPGPDGKLNQVSAKEALLGYVRAVSGGVPTKHDQESIINDLGGVGDKAKRKLQEIVSGGAVTPEDAVLIKQAIDTQIRYRGERVNKLRTGFASDLESHPGLARLTPEGRKSLIRSAGFGPVEGQEAPAQAGPREGQIAKAPGKPDLVFKGGKWQTL